VHLIHQPLEPRSIQSYVITIIIFRESPVFYRCGLASELSIFFPSPALKLQQRQHHSTRDNRQLTTASPFITPSIMISRKALSRGAQLASRRQQTCTRAYAAAASAPSSFIYDTSEVVGVKVASRDSQGPTTKLAVVAKAGTRYQPAPGLTVGLEEFAFKVSPTTVPVWT
jgi:hypothetical protein